MKMLIGVLSDSDNTKPSGEIEFRMGEQEIYCTPRVVIGAISFQYHSHHGGIVLWRTGT